MLHAVGLECWGAARKNSGLIMSADLTLAFAGDLLLGGEWPDHAQAAGKDLLAPFVDLTRELESADILFINLEGPISGTVLSQTGNRSARLSNNPQVIGLLKRARQCICILANNHIMDRGAEGLAETRRLLESQGIFCVGAGAKAAEAQRPVVVECKGKRVGCVAFTSDDPDVSAMIAKEEAPGCAGLANIEAQIRSLKAKCDIVVVSAHWGIEFFQYPTAEQVAVAKGLADAGADYLMGHHPHVLQGIEQIGGCLVMYSLGHFFVPPFRRADGEMIRPKPDSREFALVKTTNKTFEIVGGKMANDFVLHPYDAAGQRALRNKLERLAPGNTAGDYTNFAKQYYASRLKELQRERKLESLTGFVREPVKEIKRRLAVRSSTRTCSA